MFRNGLGNRPFNTLLFQDLPLKQPFRMSLLPFKKIHRPASLKCFETASETAPSTPFFLKALPSNSPSGRRCRPSRKYTVQLAQNVSKRPRKPPLQHPSFSRPSPQTALLDVVVALQENTPSSCPKMFRNGLENRLFNTLLSQGLPLKQPLRTSLLPFKKMHRPASLKCFETALETAPSTSFFLKTFPPNSPSGCRCCPSRKHTAQLA